MCSDLNSIGLVQDTRRSVESTGGITAHELGHIFNMNHDDDSECFTFCMYEGILSVLLVYY